MKMFGGSGEDEASLPFLIPAPMVSCLPLPRGLPLSLSQLRASTEARSSPQER